jgi:hypothetical protein
MDGPQDQQNRRRWCERAGKRDHGKERHAQNVDAHATEKVGHAAKGEQRGSRHQRVGQGYPAERHRGNAELLLNER